MCSRIYEKSLQLVFLSFVYEIYAFLLSRTKRIPNMSFELVKYLFGGSGDLDLVYQGSNLGHDDMEIKFHAQLPFGQ